MHRCGLVVGLVLIGLVLGCSGPGRDRPKTVKAGGKVTLDGVPVEGATVTFSPQAKDGRAAFGKTDSQGRFTLAVSNTIDGVVPGAYQVGISKEKSEGEMTTEQAQEYFAKTGQSPPPPKTVNELPEKYKDPASSGLTATVEAGKPNEFTFDLKK